jgi:hypothetical protein
MGFHHTTSLEECISICLAVRPLCRAVAYVPGLNLGYANCWPKNGNPDTAAFSTPDGRKGTIHTAVIDEFDRIDANCSSNTHYETQDNQAFDIHCGQVNSGRNFTSVHAQNITACVDACAVNPNNCTGVNFDPSLTSGYRNCYLQNTTSIVLDNDKWTYAIISGAEVPSSSPPANSGLGDLTGGNSKNTKSKAWIAGPVVGGLALLAVGGFLIFWWRRRKSHIAGADVSGSVPKDGYYSGGPAGVGSYNPAQQQQHDMHGHFAPELEGANEYQPMMKYAHTAPPYHDEEGVAAAGGAVEVPGTAEPQELGGAAAASPGRREGPQELGS